MTRRLPIAPRPSGSTRSVPSRHSQAGQSLLETTRLGRSIADCTEAIRLNAKDASAYQRSGASPVRDTRRVREVDCRLHRGHPARPKLRIAHTKRGTVYGKQGEYDKVDCRLHRGHPLRPKGRGDILQSGHVLQSASGEFGKAIADCTEAIRLNPKDVTAHTPSWVWSTGTCGEFDKAIAKFTEAIRLNPTVPRRTPIEARPTDGKERILQGGRPIPSRPKILATTATGHRAVSTRSDNSRTQILAR